MSMKQEISGILKRLKDGESAPLHSAERRAPVGSVTSLAARALGLEAKAWLQAGTWQIARVGPYRDRRETQAQRAAELLA